MGGGWAKVGGQVRPRPPAQPSTHTLTTQSPPLPSSPAARRSGAAPAPAAPPPAQSRTPQESEHPGGCPPPAALWVVVVWVWGCVLRVCGGLSSKQTSRRQSNRQSPLAPLPAPPSPQARGLGSQLLVAQRLHARLQRVGGIHQRKVAGACVAGAWRAGGREGAPRALAARPPCPHHAHNLPSPPPHTPHTHTNTQRAPLQRSPRAGGRPRQVFTPVGGHRRPLLSTCLVLLLLLLVVWMLLLSLDNGRRAWVCARGATQGQQQGQGHGPPLAAARRGRSQRARCATQPAQPARHSLPPHLRRRSGGQGPPAARPAHRQRA